jgi:hypothetical protein
MGNSGDRKYHGMQTIDNQLTRPENWNRVKRRKLGRLSLEASMSYCETHEGFGVFQKDLNPRLTLNVLVSATGPIWAILRRS